MSRTNPSPAPAITIIGDGSSPAARPGIASTGVAPEILVPARNGGADGAGLAAPAFSGSAEKDVCGLCDVQFSKYTCPKCNVPYCSLVCYKSERHADCAEGFYKDEFTTGLKTKKMEPSDRKKMEETLRAFEQQQLEDAEDQSTGGTADEGETLAARLEGLDLDDPDDVEKVWARFTEAEKATFLQASKSGTLGAMLGPAWVPWWHCEAPAAALSTAPAVEELPDDSTAATVPQGGTDDALAAAVKEAGIEMPHTVPALATLLGARSPAAALWNNVIDLVYSYAYTCHRYNGDVLHPDVVAESAQTVLGISFVLGSSGAHMDPRAAIQGVLMRVQESQAIFVSAELSSEVISDTMRLLHSPRFVAVALAHSHQLARVARKAQKKASSRRKPGGAAGPGSASVTLKQLEKKLWFYVVWWHSVTEDRERVESFLTTCRRDLAAEQALFEAEAASIRDGAAALKAQWGGQTPRRLIETL